MIPLEQLSVYLPYKLRLKNIFETSRIPKEVIFNGENYYEMIIIRRRKPLLHPLSKIEEEPFINELYELYGGGYSSFKAFKTDWIYGIYQDCHDRLSFEIIQYMAKNHMDIFNWIGQGLAEPIK